MSPQMNHVNIFLSGVSMATFAGMGLFFFRFWRAAQDSFFFFFAGACWLLALERVALLMVKGAEASIMTSEVEAAAWVYMLRLLAFVLILVAIIKKNKPQRG